MNFNGVAKFGGSSVADAKGMRRCAEIIKSNEDYKIIVLSATAKTTNELEEVAEFSLENKSNAITYFHNKIFNRHVDLALELGVCSDTKGRLNQLKDEALGLINQLNNDTKLWLMDQLYSIGERLSATIFSSYLAHFLKDSYSVLFLDARDIIKTDDNFSNGNPLIFDIKKSYNSLSLKPNEIYVTSGFIGKTLDGKTTTLGREGSDFSATLFAEAMDAKFVHIWTDVPGIASIDPRKTKNARFINSLSYEAATLLAKSGAKVLFPRTLEPAKRKDIPVWVKSSKNRERIGTIIDSNQKQDACFFGIATIKKELVGVVSVIGHELKDIIRSWDLYLENVDISYKLLKFENNITVFQVALEDIDRFEIFLHDKILSIDKY